MWRRVVWWTCTDAAIFAVTAVQLKPHRYVTQESHIIKTKSDNIQQNLRMSGHPTLHFLLTTVPSTTTDFVQVGRKLYKQNVNKIIYGKCLNRNGQGSEIMTLQRNNAIRLVQQPILRTFVTRSEED